MDSTGITHGLQELQYTGSDTEWSAEIKKNNVVIRCNIGEHTHGSNKMKLINRIDYNWEFQYYPGQIIAAHINGKVIAYGMKGKDGGMIRVTNQETGNRALIKNRRREVKDISFAFSRQQVVLGSVDDEGSVWIYEIIDSPESIAYNQLLHIYHRPSSITDLPNYRLIWCPYVNFYDDEEGETIDDPEKMFVVLNGSKAEVWNYGIINLKYGNGPIEPNEDYRGYVEINHTADLIDASFSSDGTAIAVASEDGYVKFFQVYMIENEKQKCLHEWIPHNGRPLSSIIFVDNLLECSSQCWKFTITGANYNSEIKLWSCESWSCIQSIHFAPHPDSVIKNNYLKMSIDYTGKFLVLSDVNNKSLYVMNLKRDDQAQSIAVTMLSQFLLPASFLSFHIVESDIKKFKTSELINSDDYCDDGRELDEDEEEEEEIGIVLKMLVIQQKKFQECNLVFLPKTMLIESKIMENGLDEIPDLDVTLLLQSTQLSLKENETSPIKNEKKKTQQENIAENDNIIEFQRPEKDNFASGGSSPSREVQEILSVNNSITYGNQDFFDDVKSDDENELPQKDDLIYQDNTNTNAEIIWPKIPTVKENEIVKDNTIESGSSEDISNNENDWSKTTLQSIESKIKKLDSTIKVQSLVLQNLQKDVKAVTNNAVTKDDLIKELELTMSKQQLQIAKMLENLINMQKNNELKQQDILVASFSQVINKSINDKIQSAISNEMKNVVVPSIRNFVDTLKHHLDVQNSQKINSDMLLQDKISKIINHKALAESLSMSVAKVISPILEKCYKEMICSSLLPSWEKICGNMFHQINETFTQGTKEYTASVEQYMERQRRAQEKGKDLISQMELVSDTLQQNTEKLTNVLTSEIHKQFNVTFKMMQEVMTHNIREVVGEQVKQGFKNHASVIEDSVINAVRSRAVTPSPHCDSQVTIVHLDHLISRENYEEAFQLALSAENLNFVIYVCEKVDVNVLFGDKPPPQNCILALIQQLSVDLSKHTEIKLTYIRAALVALVPDYPNTKQFIPKVLKDLLRQLQLFMSSSPPARFIYEAKLLKMAAESILREEYRV